jgi:hypothetical protein
MVDSCRECSRESTSLRVRIDAALAERQDSAKDVVEWLTVEVESKTKQNVVLIGQNGRLQLEVERLKRLSEGKS